MIYIRKLFTQDLRDGKQIAFPKEPSYDFFKFDYQNNESDRNIEFIFEGSSHKYQNFAGKKIETRLYAAGSESRIDGELKAFIRDDLKIEIDDLLILKSDGKSNTKFKFSVVTKDEDEYPLYLKIINSANHTLIEEETKNKTISSIDKPHNRIIFGAPGTGKSFQINEDAKAFGDNYERVTFHPNYSYAQFVGTYKPVMKSVENTAVSENNREIVSILKGKDSTQEKYEKLSKYFIENNRNFVSVSTLLGIFTDDNFQTINKDGTKEVELSPYVNVGKALRDLISIKGLNDNSEITYSYIPGPFIRILEKALYSQQIGENEPYLLIIEEINRAVVSAVFGDTFQLLDRNENYESQYEIDMSEDLYNYLTSDDNEATGHKKLNIGKKIKIPSNMYIWATMNSADQGVQPMDAAFKRRWDFEYLPLDEHEKDIENYQLPFPIKDNGYQLTLWKDVRSTINELLKRSGNINEDKLLGPFFISKNVLKKYNGKTDEKIAKEFSDLFKSKVLMYLYEDVCKINPTLVFKNVKSKTGVGKAHFSDVCEAFDETGIEIFEE